MFFETPIFPVHIKHSNNTTTFKYHRQREDLFTLIHTLNRQQVLSTGVIQSVSFLFQGKIFGICMLHEYQAFHTLLHLFHPEQVFI